MQLRSALLAATILATPFAASAQPITGLYVGAGAGVNITQKENISGTSVGLGALTGTFLSTNGNVSGSTGFVGLINVGWGFGNGLRAEVEGNYRNNKSDFSNGNFNNFGVAGGTTEQKFGGMVNVLYDFNGLTPWFVPYVGVGAGYLGISEKFNTRNNIGFTVPPGALSAAGQTFAPGSVASAGQSTKGAFAYQAILGAAMPLQIGMPGLAVTLEYRFLGTTGHRDYGGVGVATANSGAVFATPVHSRQVRPTTTLSW